MNLIFQEVLKKKKEPLDELFKWQLLQEEKLEANLKKILADAKKEMLVNFNKEFVTQYSANKSFSELTKLLNDIKFKKQIKYYDHNVFNFKVYTFPHKLKQWFMKDVGHVPNNAITVVSKINTEPFEKALDDSAFKAYDAGGQSVFGTFDINVDFALRDFNVEEWLKNYNIQLSDQVAKEISTKIKFEILEGIRNAESIPDIRSRILDVWNKPIDVVVPPKLDDAGNILRQGYQYQLKPDQWATTVARTEVSRAFAEGKLEGYKQTGVVSKVQFVATPDERLCPACGTLDGEEFKVDEASMIIPVHANCRCTWIPVITGDFKEVQEKARDNVEKLYKQPTQQTSTLTPKPEETKLISDKIKSDKKLGGGINETRITSDGVKGVFKPVSGEVDARKSIKVGTYYKREVAAYKVDQIIGTDLVPPTVIRKIGDQVGSHQLFRSNYEVFGSKYLSSALAESRRKMGFLDYIIGSEDRHPHNFMIHKAGGLGSPGDLIAIDNGLAFGRFHPSYFRSYFQDEVQFVPLRELEGIKEIYANFNWSKMELMKAEIFDSGLIEVEAFKPLMGRVRSMVQEGYIPIQQTMNTSVYKVSEYYKNMSFEDAWADLKEVFRQAGKL